MTWVMPRRGRLPAAPAGAYQGNLPPPAVEDPLVATRAAWRTGRMLILLFFGVGGLWAALAPLQVAIVAGGRVSAEGGRLLVQPSADGVVRAIPVRDGTRVARGQTLVVLEDVQARSGYRAELERVRMLAATEARLRAERDGSSELDRSHPMLADPADPDTTQVVRMQALHLRTEFARRSARSAVLRQRISQLESQIAGERQQKALTTNQLALIGEQIASVKALLDRGFATKTRYLELRRAEAGLAAAVVAHDTMVARLQEAIGEVQLELISQDSEAIQAASDELGRVQLELAVAEQALDAARDRLARTELKSPVAGTVSGLGAAAVGNVVRAAEPLMEIVPIEEQLVVDVQVRPQDIDDIVPGQAATLVFAGLPRNAPHETRGKVTTVSPSATTDSRSGQAFYKIGVAVSKRQLEADMPGFVPVSGMPVEVSLLSGSRTLLDYLTDPVANIFRRGMRER